MDFPPVDTLLFFGSFDPFTRGHTAVIDRAITILHPQTIECFPAREDYWGKTLTDAVHRIAMIQMVIDAHPFWKGMVSVNDCQITENLSGKTIDTLEYLAKTTLKGKKVGLLMGSDSLAGFPTWNRAKEILSNYPIFAISRGDQNLDDQLKTQLGQSIFVIDHEDQESELISSTRAKEQLVMLPHALDLDPAVESYVITHHLYGR